MTAPPASAPEPLPRPAPDSHTHLDMLPEPVEDALAAARAAGLAYVVTVGCDVESSRWSERCAADHDAVYAAVAIHPNETASVSGDALRVIEELAGRPEVVAVGETGLDYYRDHSPPDVQQYWFRQHIEIAKRTGKALMIHDRDAHADVLRILTEQGPPEHVIFHCFSGDAEMAEICAGHGYVMSFAGNVTFSNAGPLREAVLAAPPGLILAETDAPFLTPVPNRGRSNSPAQAATTLRFLAGLKGLDVAAFCDTVTATAGRVFGIADRPRPAPPQPAPPQPAPPQPAPSRPAPARHPR